MRPFAQPLTGSREWGKGVVEARRPEGPSGAHIGRPGNSPRSAKRPKSLPTPNSCGASGVCLGAAFRPPAGGRPEAHTRRRHYSTVTLLARLRG